MLNQQYVNPFLEVVKNTEAFIHLSEATLSNRLSHAYIIESGDSFGALLLVRAVTSLSLQPQYLAHEGRHPDVYEAPKNDSKKILVADIDAIIEDTLKRPSYGDKKFYVLNNFDTANIQSQNKLLKSLEEPAKGTHFFLCAANTNALVQPVLSRCQKITLNNFTTADIQFALSNTKIKADKIQINTAVELSGGSIQNTVNFLENKKKVQVFNTVLEVLLNIRSSKDVLGAVALLTPYKDFVEDILGHIGTILRDVMLLHINEANNLSLKSYLGELEQLKELYSIKAIANIILHLQQMAKRNNSNANFNSLLDDLVFGIAQFRSKR